MSTVPSKLFFGTLLTGVGILSGQGALSTIAGGLGINWGSEAVGAHLPAALFRQIPATSPLEQAYRSAFTEALDTLQAQYVKTVDPRSDLRAFKLLRASFKEAAAYQYADDLDAPRTVQDRLAILLNDLLHGHEERQVRYLQTHLLLTVTDRFLTTVMNDHAALTQYGTLLMQHLRTEMHQGQESLTTQLSSLTQSMDTVVMLLQQQFQALERALTTGIGQLEERYRQMPPTNHLEGTNIAKDVVGTVIQTVKNITTTRPPPIAPVSRDTRTVAEAMLDDLPLDAIPEPVHQFAPESRWYGRERNPDFVGRESELRQLAASLKTGTTAVIGPTAVAHGMGGIGKTDLATEFAFRYGRFFAGGVFWLSFAEPAQVDAEIAACGGADGLQLFLESDKLELADQVKRVIQAWSQPIPRLILCDSCEDQGVLQAYRKRIGPACRMLVTSRDQTWRHPSYTRIALDTLHRSESIRLLQRLCPHLSAAEAETIAEALGDFPLALHLAGSYLQAYDHDTVDVYLTKLRELDILGHPSMQGRGASFSPTEHDLHVGRTFAMSIERLDDTDPIDALAIHLLACAAHLAPGEPTPRDFLLAIVPDETDEDAAVDGLNRARAIGLLDGQEIITMHRLVHQFVQGIMSPQQAVAQHRVWQVIIDQINIADDQRSVRSLISLEPHLRHSATQESHEATEHRASLIDRIARFFDLQGRYSEAEPLYERALSIREGVLGPTHSSTAASLNNLAGLYESQGRYSEAEPLYERALAITKVILGSTHPHTITSMHNLAYLYEKQGRYADAESLYERALGTYAAVLGPGHPHIASSLNNLATLYESQGRYREAEPLLQRALTIREQVLGPTHPETASSLSNLAGLYESQGRYSEAEPLYERALAIRESVLGPTHPETASILNNLAALYWQKKWYKKAESLLQQALTIMEQMLGSDHPHTATSLNNLATVYRVQGRYIDAEPLYERALAIYEAVLGPEHPDTTTSLNNLATLYMDQQQYHKAEPLLQRTLTIREAVLGPTHSETARSLNNLAMLYEAQGRYGEAEPLYLRALMIREHVLGPDHPHTARSLNILAYLYYTQGRYEEVESLYLRALTIREHVLGLENPETATSLHNLAMLYMDTGRYQDALTYAERAYHIIQHHLGTTHPHPEIVKQTYEAIQRWVGSKG